VQTVYLKPRPVRCGWPANPCGGLAFVILTPPAKEMFFRGLFFNIIATIEIITYLRIVPNTA
jgi:membrane protease YdiL (CAAX protease family)